MGADRDWLVVRLGYVRLVFRLLQRVEELQALGRRRLYRLNVRIRFALHARDPPLASSSIASTHIAVSASACIVGGDRGVAAPWRGRRRCEGLLVEPSRRVPSSSQPASRPTLLAPCWTTTDNALNTLGGCTYRHFLALRRATVSVTHCCAGSFALGRAFHFNLFRGRVVYPSRCQCWLMQVPGRARVQLRCGYRCAAKSASTGCLSKVARVEVWRSDALN
jgi:hypothetical protein